MDNIEMDNIDFIIVTVVLIITLCAFIFGFVLKAFNAYLEGRRIILKAGSKEEFPKIV